MRDETIVNRSSLNGEEGSRKRVTRGDIRLSAEDSSDPHSIGAVFGAKVGRRARARAAQVAAAACNAAHAEAAAQARTVQLDPRLGDDAGYAAEAISEESGTGDQSSLSSWDASSPTSNSCVSSLSREGVESHASAEHSLSRSSSSCASNGVAANQSLGSLMGRNGLDRVAESHDDVGTGFIGRQKIENFTHSRRSSEASSCSVTEESSFKAATQRAIKTRYQTQPPSPLWRGSYPSCMHWAHVHSHCDGVSSTCSLQSFKWYRSPGIVGQMVPFPLSVQG
jgi:hypothetical protein